MVQAPVHAGERGAPRRSTQDTDAIITQLKLHPTAINPYIYTCYYKGNRVLVERQRGNLGMTSLCLLVANASFDDMDEETDSAQGELFDDSNSTEEVVSGGIQVMSISVPMFTVETIH